jgi:hypothetical protein
MVLFVCFVARKMSPVFLPFDLDICCRNSYWEKHRKNSDTIPKQREGNAAGDEKCEKYGI